MRRELAAVYDELLRRQREGEKSVFLTEEALSILREAAREDSPASEAQEGAPERDRQTIVPELSKAPAGEKTAPKKARAVAKPELKVPEAPVVDLPEGDRQARWEALRGQVLTDAWCLSQVKPGKQVVFGVGNIDARIFFCGEAPGADEEIRGEPFVGPAGQLLTKIIQAMGLQREDVYIANIMNYRPPLPSPIGNRPPEPQEMAYCLPYLLGQLEIVQPEVIVALGNTAIEGLLGHDPKRRIGKIRGQWMEFKGIPLLPTYHPSYLLRNQGLHAKRQVWEDMLTVMDRLGMQVSEKQRGYFLK
ncbi:MAG: uracil-DNA glycosylase [Oceanipulchritudo sp.]